MRYEWLIKNYNTELIIFFAGWGMDERPFRHMSSEGSDVLVSFDYRDMTVTDSIPDISGYKSISILAWSLGVSAANLIVPKLPFSADKAVAVSGTPFPAHDEYGIPEEIFEGTSDSLDKDNLHKFYRRMCRDRETLSFFHENAPVRELDDLHEELSVFRQLIPGDETIFRKAIVYQDDRIIPPENQMNYWQKAGVPTLKRTGYHFPFYKDDIWEDFLDD